MDAAKSGCAEIRVPMNDASAAAAKQRSASRRDHRFRRDREAPIHISAQDAPPLLTPMHPPWPRAQLRSVFGVKGRSCALLACSGAARNHRSCAVPETRKANHRDVDEQEQHKSQRNKEVNCASGLAATEQSNGGRKGGDKRGRQRQACPDDQWEENENHKDISEALKHVVRGSLCLTRPFKTQRFCD